jgi:hypothetical protein
MNLPMPVLIILHNEKANTTYWQVFDLKLTEGTPKGWKINIPEANRFESGCKIDLLNILGPEEDHLGELEAHWAINGILEATDFIHYAIDREDIESLNDEPIVAFFDRIKTNDNLCRKSQGKIEISVSGYDNDARELWETAYVKRWFKMVDEKINWLFFCKMSPPAHGFKLYAACICDTRWLTNEERLEYPGCNVLVDSELMADMFKSNYPKFNEMTFRLGMSMEDNKRITFESFDVLGIPHD